MIARIFFLALACASLAAGAAEPAPAQRPAKSPTKPPAAAKKPPTKSPPAKPAAPQSVPDSRQMERELQGMTWPQFRSVIEAIPEIKAEIEARGSAGWLFVQANYRRHGWKKHIDRLDAGQKRQLAELIARAKQIS